MEEKLCLNCGELVGPGRKDKKYCSEPCRTEYHNKQKEQKQQTAEISIPDFVPDINQILLQNWKILHECLGGQSSCRMRIRELSGRGFNFKFFTSERTSDQDEEVYYFCYDVGYKLLNEDSKVIIVQNNQMVRLNGPAYGI